jgi:DNA-binding response OmpR family regulator
MARTIKDDPQLSLLIIEDDPAMAEMYRRKFESDGYAVTVARDGEAGLAAAVAEPADLIFLDVRLPRMDGLAVLEAIRGNPATESLPVVILTNLDEDDLRAAGARLGVSDWLIKSQVTPGGVSARVSDWADVRPKATR